MLDIHASALMLAASQRNADKLHPFDYLFRAIDCKIRALEQNEQEAQFVLKYIYSSCNNAKIHSIYKLERPGECVVFVYLYRVVIVRFCHGMMDGPPIRGVSVGFISHD